MTSTDNEASQPLLRALPEPRQKDYSFERWSYLYWLNPAKEAASGSRHRAQRFLTSKAGHYFVLALVSLDVSSIIADFIVRLYQCERPDSEKGWDIALDALGIVSLVFSCLFMAELLASVWAFGSSYFRSAFHIFDAIVIVVGFVVDVLLHGALEEVASLVVVLRLWRVFKIIEELSVGAEEQMDDMDMRIRSLERENADLEKRLREVEEGQAHGGSGTG